MTNDYPDFEGGKSGLYSVAEWAAKEGADKNFRIQGLNKANAEGVSGYYTVPTGKTLYMCGASFHIFATASLNADLNQIGMFALINVTTSTVLFRGGGNGGGSCIFSRPIVFTAGQQMQYHCVPYANHNCNLDATFWGYEI